MHFLWNTWIIGSFPWKYIYRAQVWPEKIDTEKQRKGRFLSWFLIAEGKDHFLCIPFMWACAGFKVGTLIASSEGTRRASNHDGPLGWIPWRCFEELCLSGSKMACRLWKHWGCQQRNGHGIQCHRTGVSSLWCGREQGALRPLGFSQPLSCS